MGVVNSAGSPFVNNSPPAVQDNWLNGSQNEINNVITSISEVVAGGDLNQLGDAIATYSGDGDFFLDSGSANSYTLGALSTKRAPVKYTTGMRVRFVPGNDNTGASNIDVVGIGSKAILDQSGSPLVGGEIFAGIKLELFYDGADFRLSSIIVSISVDKFTKSVTQTSHGFVAGDVIRRTSTDFTKAQADTEANSQVVGMVESVQGDDFVLTQVGFIDTVTGLIAGDTYYLSSITPGAITNTKPTTIGEFVVPVFITETTTSGYVLSQFPLENTLSIEVASQAEVDTGTNNVKAVTPLTLSTNQNYYIIVEDQKTSGTQGGTFTSGAWQTRTLNTVVINTITGASLSSDQIILPEGTYEIEALGSVNDVNTHKLKLRNITDVSDVIIGLNVGAGSGGAQPGPCNGIFTIASTKTFEIQHRCVVTQATNGFGVAAGFGVIEVYCAVKIIKFK